MKILCKINYYCYKLLTDRVFYISTIVCLYLVINVSSVLVSQCVPIILEVAPNPSDEMENPGAPRFHVYVEQRGLGPVEHTIIIKRYFGSFTRMTNWISQHGSLLVNIFAPLELDERFLKSQDVFYSRAISNLPIQERLRLSQVVNTLAGRDPNDGGLPQDFSLNHSNGFFKITADRARRIFLRGQEFRAELQGGFVDGYVIVDKGTDVRSIKLTHLLAKDDDGGLLIRGLRRLAKRIR